MPRGPSPKPTALRLVDGDRESRINRSEPLPLEENPEPPAYLSKDTREVWDFTIRQLKAMKIAKACDRDSLVAYCEAVTNHRNASQLLARSSVLITGVEGKPVRNPVLAIQRDNANLIRVFAQEFGLTPSARSRIKATEEEANEGDNPFARSS